MSPGNAASSVSAHVRYSSRDSLVDALVQLGVGRGVPVPVWPPRRLPYGLFLSPSRNGWISIWSPLDNVRDWFPQLTATLECPGTIFEVIESQFWIAEFYRDESFLGRMELPTEAVEYDDLWARTVDSLEAEGVPQPWEDEARFGTRMDQIAASHDYQEDLRQLREERPLPELLSSFVPPHSSVEQAWEILTAIDRRNEEENAEESEYAEDYQEAFAGYLGVRNASWDPRADLETFLEGDYEEEGLPDDWTEFVVLPVPQLPVF